MTATSEDYLWFEHEFPDLAEAYCVTLVRGVTADELLDRFGVTGERFHHVGLDDLIDLSYDIAEARESPVQLVAAAAVGGWALAVEANGYLGVTDDLVGRLSTGTRLVSHFCNVNAVDQFCLADDGMVKLAFEPLFAWHRSGSDPDGYADLMRSVGLRTSDDDEIGAPTAAAFALAEALSGVQLTADLLRQTAFVCGEAPMPAHGWLSLPALEDQEL